MARIVVLDDRLTNRKIFSKLASTIEAGAEVVAFASPFEALQFCADNVVDLIVTDFKMPGMDGAEFIHRLRALPASSDIPVIVITAYEDRIYRLRALEAGATDFLQSPVDHQEFVTRGRNVMHLGFQQRVIRARADELRAELAQSELSLETTIRDSRLRLAQVIDTIPAMIGATNQNGTLVFENQYRKMNLRRDAGPAAGLTVVEDEVFATGRPRLGYEDVVIDQHGVERTFITSKFPLLDQDGAVRHLLTTSFDITDRKLAETALQRLAHYDTLTGLANRALLSDRLNDDLMAARHAGRGFALHYIDLDRFKNINDGFGHDYGDRLLKEIAVRLAREVREVDLAARLGGDEFAIVQANVQSIEEAQVFAERVSRSIEAPFDLGGHTVTVGASIGTSIAPGDASTAEQLLKNSDLAMYSAKRDGRGCTRFFSPVMATLARDTVLLEIDLRKAIEADEFVIYFQPQVDVSTMQIIGAESLLRWKKPGAGLQMPGAFLPFAEESGLIVAIDRWVLREVCHEARRWELAGKPMPVSVNVSATTFRRESVLELARETLERTGLSPHLLELELTESTLLGAETDIVRDLHALRRLGVRIAIDDFGTGYSSLSYLQRLPIDRLKIDRSFLSDVGPGSGNMAIVEAVLGIGRSLRLEVIAEGVETTAQLRRAFDSGCHLMQGFLLGAPLPAVEFNNRRLAALVAQTEP